MGYYYKEYNNSYSPLEKSKYIYNFGEVLLAFLNIFDKEGNDTLGNKYFLYIKLLFESYKIFIQLNKVITVNEKILL